MNKNEIIARIVEKVSDDNELVRAFNALAGNLQDCEEATEQRPNTMYVLTTKVRVKTEDEAEIYHYHPLVEESLLDGNDAESNKMVASGDLLELQKTAQNFRMPGIETVLLAIKTEEYERLQEILDVTINSVMVNTRKAADLYLNNAAYTEHQALNFEDIYQYIIRNLMFKSYATIGAALDKDCGIIEKIDGVQYERSVPEQEDYDGDEDDDYCDEDDEENDEDADDDAEDDHRRVFLVTKL